MSADRLPPRARPHLPRALTRHRPGYRPLPLARLTAADAPGHTGTARPRDLRGRPGRHRSGYGARTLGRRRRGTRWWRLGSGLAAAAATTALSVVLASGGSGAAGAPATETPRHLSPVASVDPVPVAPRVSPDRAPSSRIAAWQGVLTGLDTVRARAWASRRPDLLAAVYAADLARLDATRLRAAVPTGCGLHGVHTDYRTLATRDTGGGAALVVLARLRPSRLVCGTQVRALAAGTAPVRLRVDVALTRAGPRIVAEQRL